MIESREALHAVFAKLSGTFAQVGELVQSLEAKRNTCMDDIEKASEVNPLQKNSLQPKNDLYKIVEATFAAIKAETDNWRKEVDSFEKCTSFRQRHGDSLLIYVYGKVKSGKSSLGNYLAYGVHNPTPAQVAANPDVRVFFEDDSGQYNAQAAEIYSSRCLKVDFLEATSAIQGYIFPGLTWVDSPGIHSMTTENGELAREYLKSADMVLYTTSSKSALKASDLQELRSILDTGKPFVLLATKCSDWEEDEDEVGNVFKRCVMLSPMEQEEVCKWCVEQLMEEGKKNDFKTADRQIRIFPISALYAEHHPDAKGWETSGMAQLASCLASEAQNDGVRIKKQAPLQNLWAYNKKVLKSLENLEGNMKATQSAMKSTLKDMEREKERQLSKQSLVLIDEIERLAHFGMGQDEAFREKVIQVAQRCVDEANDAITTVFMDSAAALIKQNRSTSFANISFKGFENIYQEIRYQTSVYKRGGGFLGTIGGGLVGFLVGGPVGMMVGSILGGAGGGAAGSCFDGSEVDRVQTGNNSAEVRRNACSALEQALDKELKVSIAMLEESCIQPIQNWLETFNAALSTLKNELLSQQHDIEQELSK